MVYSRKCGSKMVSKDNEIYAYENRIINHRQTYLSVILAILINGILIISSYNYAQHLAYKENVQVIKLENYKNIQRNIEQKHIQLQNMNRIIYND